MQVVILYNEPVLPADHPDAESEHEILFTVDAVVESLTEAGYDVSRLGVRAIPRVLCRACADGSPTWSSISSRDWPTIRQTEAHVAGLLEWLGMPFTGCPYQTLCLARSKHLTKHLLHGAGLPTPTSSSSRTCRSRHARIEWPVIVKPAMQDASVGLDQGSVVTKQHDLNERVAYLLDTYGPPVLVEQFIRGREFNVGLIEAPDLRVLPVSEILFTDRGPGLLADRHLRRQVEARLARLRGDAAAYPAEVSPRCREKLDKTGQASLPPAGLPRLCPRRFPRAAQRQAVHPGSESRTPISVPLAGLSGGLVSAGITHAQFTVELVHAAVARGERGFTVAPVWYDVSDPTPLSSEGLSWSAAYRC